MILPLLLAGAMAFPDIEVTSLGGRAGKAHDLNGTPVAWVLGFTYGSREGVERWVTALESGAPAGLRVVQMPVLTGLTSFFRPLMARAITGRLSPAKQANFFFTTDRDRLVSGLKLPRADNAPVVVLVDGNGRVRDLVQGEPGEAETRGVLESWREIRPGAL